MSAQVIVGLKARDRLVGILMLGPKVSGEVYGDDDLKLVSVVSRQVAITFDNAELYHQARWAYEQLKETQARLVQAERLRALGEMAGGVAHDFNNLLAAMLGRAQLAMEYATDEKVKADLEIIQQAALDGAETVKRLQDFARVRVDRENNLVDPNQLVETSLSFIEPRRREREQTGQSVFSFVLSLEQVGPVSGNSGELRQVLTNIMLNALDAMPQGGTLSVKTHQQDGMAVIAIADTGAGIPPEIQGKVFDPFFTTKGPRGTGLGLSVAYGIVHRHGGAIDLVSAVGKGTTFHVRLPLTAPSGAVTVPPTVADGVPPAQPPEVGQPERQPLSASTHILVIDDDPAVAEVLRLLLQQKGYEVSVAATGEDGLAAFAASDYQLVIVDMGLPR
ncbi:MAG: ATP-binding protein, partial [Chloroflexota bacterium]